MKKAAAVLVSLLVVSLSTPLLALKMRTHTEPGLGGCDLPFFPDGDYRSDVDSPSEFLGFELGSRPVSHEEVVAYFTYLDNDFHNASLVEYGETYEGRRLVYLVITSEENSVRLQDIREKIARLADPRTLRDEKEALAIIDSTPAVAWMAYAIHGDELSSTDAALQLAYQLIAGTDAVTANIRDNVVVCIDPLQNPDGRARWLTQIGQWNSVVPNTDVQSLHHRGTWPWGRGNHYLFDLNRDWFSLVHPETRGRVTAVLTWNPQFLVDCHEMGPLATYLFSPPREPFNPFMIRQIHKWWDIVARDQAHAFDRYGWSYYTREWNEEFFPGYGSSWAIYTGAVGMLYEQAGVDGSQVKRLDGTVMTFREAVHHQFTGSMANLTTVANNRKALLEDYFAEKKRVVGRVGGGRRGNDSGPAAAFVFPPSKNASRLDRFAQTLQRQNIEVEAAAEAFTLKSAKHSTGRAVKSLGMPEGTLVVKLNQPLRHLIEAILTFDIRIASDFLETERKAILKEDRTRLYETTGWSLPLAYNVESYFTEKLPAVKTTPYESRPAEGRVIASTPRFGYAIEGTDDRSCLLLAHLLESGVKVWCAKKPFEVEGRRFPTGSYLIKNSGNPDLEQSVLTRLAEEHGVDIIGVNSALATSGADLGGDEFTLLELPRIAIVGGTPVSTSSFGAAWHLLDSRFGYRTSALEIATLTRMDLRKYNVLVLPSIRGSTDDYKRLLGKGGIEKLKTWVKDGGTLITVGNATAFAADSSVALTSVRPRRQVLKDLDEYTAALEYARTAEEPELDSLAIWEAKPAAEGEEGEERQRKAVDALTREDETARKLRPRGVILGAVLDETNWLAFGSTSPLPVFVRTGYVYLAKNNVQVAARFAEPERLRFSGLLWPEARERWSETVYAAREGMGNGQVIVFAGEPVFRGYFHGSERLFLNAIFLGPGFGTRRPLAW